MTDAHEPESHVDVGPHKFQGRGGRCRACYLPRSAHPTRGYTKARPMSGPPSWRLYLVIAIVVALVLLRACGPL